MLLNEAIDKFIKYVKVTKSKGTNDYYKYYLKVLNLNMGKLNCETINNDMILNFIISQRDRNPNISNATLNKFIGTLKTVLLYSSNIELKFSKLKEQKKIIPTVSLIISNRIFNYYQKNMKDKNTFRNYVFLKLLLDTGLRLSEIINIKLYNIDFITSSIHVRVTKTDVDRYVCFTESTRNLLNKFIVTNSINNYIFYDFKTNNKMTTSSVESFIYRLKKKLNIGENITPHKWRHTFATNYLKNGGDLETLRLLLGHSNLKTTQKYLHLNKQDIINNYMNVMQNL